jgi:dynein intermediate chain 2
MELFYSYQKVRATFGNHCDFKDVEARILESIPSTDAYKDDYIMRNPSVTELDTTPHMSYHEINTDRITTGNSGCGHIEGGWPENVDVEEANDTTRFRKKMEKGDEFKQSVKHLGPILDRCMRQNNTINIFEEYFEGDTSDHSSEPPSAKGLAVFRDPNNVKRTVTSINWCVFKALITRMTYTHPLPPSAGIPRAPPRSQCPTPS